MKKASNAAAIILVVFALLYTIGGGFMTRGDVYRADYAAAPYGTDISIHVGVAGSAGYVRGWRDVSKDPSVMEIKFYSAFGGVNGKIAASDNYVLPLAPECEAIAFVRADGVKTVLIKNGEGEWVVP